MNAGEKTVSSNRRAGFDYHILKTFEAGLALTGTEIKSVREGHAASARLTCARKTASCRLVGANIARYAPASRDNHDPTRSRKLLLHKREIHELEREATTAGATIIPVRMYLKYGRAKLEIALARGKRKYDKREAIAEREAERSMQRAMRTRA